MKWSNGACKLYNRGHGKEHVSCSETQQRILGKSNDAIYLRNSCPTKALSSIISEVKREVRKCLTFYICVYSYACHK